MMQLTTYSLLMEIVSVVAGVVLLLIGWAQMGSALCGWMGALLLLFGSVSIKSTKEK